MSEKHEPIFTPLSWTLILMLVGLYALYSWHQGNLKESLAGKEAKLSETTQLLTAKDAKLDTSEQTIQGLQADIEALTGQYRQQEQSLMDELGTAKQDLQGLMADMEALRTEDAAILDAEAQKASQAYAELHGRFEAANQQIAALGTDIEQLNQDMAAAMAKSNADAEQAAAAHQAQMAEAEAVHQAAAGELEQQLNGRISFFRTALEGSDPERAAQMIELDEQLQANKQSIEQLEQGVQQLETAKADLEGHLASAQQTIEDREQVLVQAASDYKALLDELSERQSELVALQTKYDQAVVQAMADLAVLDEQLAAEQKAHAETRSTHVDVLANTQQAAADDLAQARADAAAALDAANTKAAAEMEQAIADAEKVLQGAKDEAAAALQRTTAAAAAVLEETKVTHGAAIAEADGKVASLTEELGNKHEALSALQQQHDSMVAELSEKLASTEQALSGVEADLSAATQQAADAKVAYENRIAELEVAIGESKTQIAGLEQTLEQAKGEAVEIRAASEKALTDQRALYQEFAALGARNTEQGMLLSLADTEVIFAVNQASLPEELPSIDRIATLLSEHSNLTARVEGHTDSGGRDEANLELSQKRADAVRQALIDRGVSAERVTAEGIGEARPIADNKSSAGRRQNRRVEVYVAE